ncbi:MAG: hypothetical protein ACLRPV_07090 [Lacrimispora saccharolytica]
MDHIANKKADVVRMYLPPDTNCLLSCFDHCIQQQELCQCHRCILNIQAASGCPWNRP